MEVPVATSEKISKSLNPIVEKKNKIKTKRFLTALFISWMLFIGVDFLFHASIFAFLWKENIPAIKTLDNLAVLIPAGYGSFLLLTLLIEYVYVRVFKEKPALKETFEFAIIFAALFFLSNLLGVFSFVAIPFKHLVFFNAVYFIEIIIVAISLHYSLFAARLKKIAWISSLIFLNLIIAGIVIQNVR